MKERFPRALDIYRAHYADVVAANEAEYIHPTDAFQTHLNRRSEAEWRTICTICGEWWAAGTQWLWGLPVDGSLDARVAWCEVQLVKLALIQVAAVLVWWL